VAFGKRVNWLLLSSFLAASALVALSATSAASASAAVPPSLLTLFSTTRPFEVRPAVIGGWTGDGTGFIGGADGHPNVGGNFGHIRWRTWGPRSATGTGVVWGRREYSCRGSHCWTSEPTRIRASRVRDHHYTRLAFTYNQGEGRHRYAFKLYHTTWFATR
jgi:hypothetical protein